MQQDSFCKDTLCIKGDNNWGGDRITKVHIFKNEMVSIINNKCYFSCIKDHLKKKKEKKKTTMRDLLVHLCCKFVLWCSKYIFI